MIIIPSIDLLDGQVVRLRHGDFNERTFYDVEAAELAARYHAQGAEWLHVVDLEASRHGAAADTSDLFELLARTVQSVQTGGGVRSGGDVRARLEAGAQRVVVGSLCVTETDRFVRWIGEFGAERMVAAVDVHLDRSGVPRPRIHGWTEEAGVTLWELLDHLAEQGLEHALVTDIGRDGALHGPNLSLYRELRQRYPKLRIQASGGVGALSDLVALADTGVDGAITGKALLEGVFTLGQALEELEP